ncbi:hypothetical protein CFP65_4665 [Kitasatospora sp. MMS16-BH015]|uniref:hypothetical protein n=1 Tax=Kitasatospora sp. MMS16-BH015 TaxID=2018025 RepID=UPI000CA1E9BA|nr:hypothetical protein [Kitasatospora sp. MMS16-BH015]AUG79395.1 hypothetical protein CFP65_4665 [Kitasatospora sp. MMS16-BH015]
MAEQQALVTAVEALADRYRSMPQSRLTGSVPGHESRAAAALELARSFAAQALELAGEAHRDFPSAGPFAVGDQLAVAGHELAAVADEATVDWAVAELKRVSQLAG